MKNWKKLGYSCMACAMTLTLLPGNLSLIKAEDAANLAFKKTASVSEAETSYWGADKAVDGIANVDETSKPSQSRWSTDQKTDGAPVWLKVDLGEVKTFQSFVMIWERTNITSYKIQISDTGNDGDWTNAYELTGVQEISTRAEMIRLNEAVEARYVRLYIDGYTAGTLNWRSVSLYEFQIYQDNIPGNAIPMSLRSEDNKLLKKNASASESEPGTTYTPDKAVDGIVNRTVADKKQQSRWATDELKDNRDAWLKVDMGETQVVQAFRMEWERTNITAYEILLSDDGLNWQQVYTRSGDVNVSETEVVNLDQAYTGRYVKIHITGYTAGTINWKSVSLYELEAYAKPVKVDKTVAEIAASIKEASLNEDLTTLVMPEVPVGFDVALLGADYEQIIAADGSVHRPLTSQDVVLNFKISKDDETATTADIKLTVPGLYEDAGINEKPTVIPELAEWYGTEGHFTISDSSKIVLDPAVSDEYMGMAEEFATDYKDITGKDITIETGTEAKAHDFYFTTYNDQALGDEGYIMDVKDTITISSIDKTGAYWSTRSILQIIKQTGDNIPQGISRDYPKYRNRGFMLDVGRKPFQFEYVKEVAKNMSWYKLNEFQLHLSDNYIWVEDYSNKGEDPREKAYSGFRLESDIVGENGEALTAKDVFYTKDEMRDFIQGARDYGVNVIPEFDTPAHSLAYTKVRPDLSMKDKSVSRWSDHLDLTGDNYAKSVEFIQEVFNEYMTGDDPVFDKDTTINIGTDEYSSKYQKEFQKYTSDMMDFVRDSGRDVRLWGSLGGSTSVAGSPKIDPTNASLNMWNTGYANPTAMMNEGFDLINMNDGNLYIVPGANYYYDTLNPQTLYSGYNANVFGSTKLPAGTPNMAGATFAVWNDYVDKSSNGISEYEITKRIFPVFSAFSERLWGDAQDKTYNEYKDVANITGQAPNTNIKYEVDTKENDVVEYSFKNGMKDATENKYDGTALENAHIEKVDGKSALKLNGDTSYMSTPIENLAPNFEVSFDVKRTCDSTDEQVLFESSKGTIKAVQKDSGKVGYSRDFYNYSFDYTLPVNEWHNLRIRSAGTTVTLFVDDKEVSSFVSSGRVGKDAANQNNWPTLTLPLERIGSETNAFNGYISNVSVVKGTTSDKYKLPESALTATANSYNNGDNPENMIDGDANTTWHSYWSDGEQGSWPYSAILSFDKTYNINKISMLPRQSGTNGIITGYKLFAKLPDGTEKLIAEGEWAGTSALKEVSFDAIDANGLRLEATKTIGEGGANKFASIAELSVYKAPEAETPDDTTFVKGILYGAITKAEAALADEALVLAPAVQEMIEARLAIAKTIYADKNATTEEIMNAWDNLAKALQYLDFTANKKALNELITSCDDINVGDYTQGVEEYLAALDEAKAVSADENALQTRINAAYLRLLTGIEGLKASDVNKLGLKAMIDSAANAYNNAGDYNQEDASWAVFTKAFTDAQAVFNNDKATQSEVNKAMSELAGAYENIRLLPNEDLLKALKAFIETANMMNPANYRTSDVAYVRSALADAKAMLEKADITEKERKDIEERIANSYNIIANNKVENVETPGDVNETPTPEVPAQPETPKATEIKGTTKPGTTKTGDATNMAMYAILLGGAGACAYYSKKRSRKGK